MVKTIKSLYFTLYLYNKTNNKISNWLKWSIVMFFYENSAKARVETLIKTEHFKLPPLDLDI